MGRAIGTILLVVLLGLGGYAAYRGRTADEGRADPLRFFVVSDNDAPTNAVYRALLEKAKAAGAQLVLHLGDLTRSGTAAELEAALALEAEVGLPVEHVVGNHDLLEDPTRGTWGRVVGDSYRSFDWNGLHFALLDNADRQAGFSDAQLDWLDADLATDGSRYRFLAYHRPFGLPLEDVFGDDETPRSRVTNDRLRSVVRAHGPAMIFTGHLHTYLPYRLEGVRAYVTGGGGMEAQSLLGGERASFFHGLLVTVDDEDGVSVSVLRADR